MSSIRKKQYDLVIPEQQESSAKDIEHALKNAVLLSLLENKYITMWQYEQCCTKLHLSEIDKLPL